MAVGRNQRKHYNFKLGRGIESMEHSWLMQQIHVNVRLASEALQAGDRNMAIARLAAAEEAIVEARKRGEQLSLWR